MNDNSYPQILNLTAHFTLAVACPGEVDSIFALMEKVRAHLPEGKKHYLKPMHFAELQRHAFQGNVLVATDNQTGQTAGAFLLTANNNGCTSLEKFAEYPRHLMSQDTAVIKIFVDDDFRGKGLMGDLLESGEELAARQGFLDIIAKVDVNNIGSNKGFERADFEKAASGRDPALGYSVHYWYKPCGALASTDIPSLNDLHVSQSPAFGAKSISPV